MSAWIRVLETLWYEACPFLYGAVGLVAIFKTNLLGIMGGLVMLVAVGLVLHLRWMYRKQRRGGYWVRA